MPDRQYQYNVTQTSLLMSLHGLQPATGASWWVVSEEGRLSGLWFMQYQLLGTINRGLVHFRVYADVDFSANSPAIDYWGELSGGDPDTPALRWEGTYGHVQNEPGSEDPLGGIIMRYGTWSAIGHEIFTRGG